MQINFESHIPEKWLFYKIYTGPRISDEILCKVVQPTIDYLLESQFIEKWFFIRYSDPEYHIRLRVKYNNHEDIGVINDVLYNATSHLFNSNLVWKVKSEIYVRETERYGKNTIDFAEDIFYLNSTMTIDILNKLKEVRDVDVRWLVALYAVDKFISKFRVDDQGKQIFFEKLKLGFGKEFQLNRFLKKQIDSKYRKYSGKIKCSLNPFEHKSSPISGDLYKVVKQYSDEMTPTVKEILTLHEKSELKVEMAPLLTSYIHMMINRIFHSKNRAYELVLYDFLFRYYVSKNAQAKRNV